MDFSKIKRSEIIGIFAGIIMVLALIFLNWFSLEENPARADGRGFICGPGEFECTGFDTFPILRWLLIAAAVAPVILTYIVIRGNTLSWAPGEVTMVVGFTAFTLILFNGFIQKPGSGVAQSGVSLELGYLIALLAAIGLSASGIGRMLEESDTMRKTPGTV
ncbi:MAG: hypothetical protein ACR2K6_04465 [Solirubrobacterales bacterium]